MKRAVAPSPTWLNNLRLPEMAAQGASNATSYSDAARRGQPRTPAAPLRDHPLHHLLDLHERAVFIDMRAVRNQFTRKERNDLLHLDLNLQVPEVTDIYNEPTSQLLRVELASLELHAEILDRLAAGVPWREAGNALVYGWAPGDAVTHFRVSG